MRSREQMVRCSRQSILNESEQQNSLDYSVSEIINNNIIIIINKNNIQNSLLLLSRCTVLVLVTQCKVVKRPPWKQELLKVLNKNSEINSTLKMNKVVFLFLKMWTHKTKDMVINLSFLLLPLQILIIIHYQVPRLQVEWHSYLV